MCIYAHTWRHTCTQRNYIKRIMIDSHSESQDRVDTHTWLQEGWWSCFHPICLSVCLLVCACARMSTFVKVAQGWSWENHIILLCKSPQENNQGVFQEVFEKQTHRGPRCVCVHVYAYVCVCESQRELSETQAHTLRTSLDSVMFSALFAWHSKLYWKVKWLGR